MVPEDFKDWTIEDFSLDLSYSRPVVSSKNDRVWKSLAIKVGILAISAGIFISLFSLQVVQGASFAHMADSNRIEVIPIPAPRGIIYDRNGIPLVYNKETYNVLVDLSQFQTSNESKEFLLLGQILGVSSQSISNTFNKGLSNYSNFVTLSQNISQEQMIAIKTSPKLQGIVAQPTVVRSYPYGAYMGNILGYIGGVSADDLKTDSSLNDLDKIGKDGIEYQYDSVLRGVDGQEIVEVDTNGNIVNIIKTQDPIPGNNLSLSIDINVQKALADYVASGVKDSGATGGASVIENVNDGSILAMVTNPSYDDNLFSEGISEADYEKLANDPNKPFLNRAISESQPPGSVMKTITASAALQEGYIKPDSTITDQGTLKIGGFTFQNYDKIARGVLNVVGGLQWSSNIFFYNVVDTFHLPIDIFEKYAKLYDVGSKTGIDLPGEVKGQISDPQVKQEKTGQVWYEGDSLNAVIGQGYTLVTPIQISNWIASIANGGTLFVPHLAMNVTNSQGNVVNNFGPDVARSHFVSDSNLSVIRQGMYQAVHSGIDATMNTNVVSIGGKTGTAEFGALDAQGQYTHEHAWASGFAPYDKPQISFLVFLEGGGLSSNSERVAKSFLNWYYGSYLKQNPNRL